MSYLEQTMSALLGTVLQVRAAHMSAPVAAARDSAGVPHASLRCAGVRTGIAFQPARKGIWLWFSQKMKCTVAWHRGGTLCKRVYCTVGKSIWGQSDVTLESRILSI